MATAQQVKRIAAYLRRSTEDQENSIERQRMSFETYLKNSEEYEAEPEIFIEDGVSGDACVERPVQAGLLRNIEEGKLELDELFVSDSSRWGRFSTHYKNRFTLPLKVAGVALRTPSTLIDFSDPTSDLLYDLHQNLSYIENHERSHRVVSGTATKVANKTLRLHPCYGLKREDNRLVVDEEHARVVRLIFKKYLSSGSQKATAKYLNVELGVASPTGKRWSSQTVSELLRNPKVAGHYCYGRRSYGKLHSYDGTVLPVQRKEKEKGKSIRNAQFHNEYCPDLVEPIIGLDEWGRVQMMLVENTAPAPAGRGTINTLTGILRCSCGKVMRGQRKAGEAVYRCSHGKSGGCHGSTTREHKVLTTVIDAIKEELLSEDAPSKIKKLLEAQESIEAGDLLRLEELRRKYKTAEERLMDLDSVLPEKFRKQMRSLKAEVDALEAKLEDRAEYQDNIAEAATEAAEAFKGLLAGKTDEEMANRETLLQIVKEIKLSYVFQRSKSRVFAAVSEISITICPVHNVLGEKVAGTVCPPPTSLTLEIRRKQTLPDYFIPSRPISCSPMI